MIEMKFLTKVLKHDRFSLYLDSLPGDVLKSLWLESIDFKIVLSVYMFLRWQMNNEPSFMGLTIRLTS